MAQEQPGAGVRGNPEQRSADILEAASHAFARCGYRQADVQAIADALGIGKGTVYRYFPSKEQLFFAAVDRGMRQLRDAIEAARGEVSDPLDRLAVSVHTYLRFFDEHPQALELLIQERAEFRDRKKPTYFEYYEHNIGEWQRMFRSLQEQGRVRDVPVDRLLDVINDLLYGAIFTNYFAGRRQTLRQQADDILDMVFHGILSEKERARREAEGKRGQG